MKEPWKKTSDGEQPQKAANKVVITLNNDETKSEPTEVEVPVDLTWAHHQRPLRAERKCSTPRVVVLVGVVLLLGLTVITLFKVQNLIYSTSYINWRMQEIESAVSDSNDDIKLMKFKMSLDDRDEAILRARAEPLIAASNAKNLDSQDLRLSESQNHKLTNSLSNSAESTEAKDIKDSEATKSVEPETKGKESTGEDGRDHPNPADPEEWIKPLVETFDVLGNQPVEDQFIQNVLMKLLMPENNFEVLEFKKIREGENAVNQELDNQREIMQQQQQQRNNEEQKKPLPFPIESILMKTLLPPISNFKVFHFNEKPEPQPEENMSQKMMPIQALKLNQMLPPIDNLVKSLLPPANNMKILRFNDNNRQQAEQSTEEDMPKITIQSIKLKLIPLPIQDDFGGRRDSPANLLGNQINGNNNFEVIRLNESPEPSQDVEAPKMPPQFNPFPIPIQEIMRSILPTNSKHIEIVPLSEKPEDRPMPPQQQQDRDMDMNQHDKFPLPFPLQELIMKTLLTPPSQNSEEQYSKESQEQQQQQQQQNPQVEVTKIPVRTMKLNPFPLPIPEALMKPMFPFDAPIHVYEDDEDTEQPEHHQQQQQQPMDHMQMPQQPMDHIQMPQQPMEHVQMQQVPQEPQQPQQPQQQQQQQQQLPEVPRPLVRSTKLNPVESWDLSPPPQLPKEPVQQN